MNYYVVAFGLYVSSLSIGIHAAINPKPSLCMGDHIGFNTQFMKNCKGYVHSYSIKNKEVVYVIDNITCREYEPFIIINAKESEIRRLY